MNNKSVEKIDEILIDLKSSALLSNFEHNCYDIGLSICMQMRVSSGHFSPNFMAIAHFHDYSLLVPFLDFFRAK